MSDTPPAQRVAIGINLSPQNVDWPTLDAAWARVGEHPILESVWLNDHLTDPRLERYGPSWEALTTLAALAHRVPGRRVGHGVLAATFRHPSVLAKQATVLDHATGGRFILGIGAGWHEGEHRPFGIPFPSMPERFDRFESAVETIAALFSPAAAAAPGVTRADPFFPLDGATNEPGPLTPGGPPLWLGGQKRRGIALAARLASGWMVPAIVPGEVVDLDYFASKRARLLAAMAEIGRDPTGFAFAVKVSTGRTATDRRAGLANALAHARAGATDLLLSMPPDLGPAGVDALVREVAEPLREALDR